MHARVRSRDLERVSNPPGTGITDGSEMPCECWEWIPDLPQELQRLSHLSNPSPLFLIKGLIPM